ncbi:HNH endonuclease [Aquincola tertiaricarbonis]|uniref:HNH endonuclease n=1 Tax=Aquincola tertiaricarbonis TaxID=391953 RepID=UPI0009FB06EE|nr:HNH endonuclease signature motif containing protein [Aquincola tertiaricarbonis]
MTKGRLQTLAPRLAKLQPRLQLAQPVEQQRTRGRRWTEIRERILRRDPLCVPCQAKGVVQASEQVDHRIPLEQGGTDDDANLQGICKACHVEKTAGEQRRRFGHAVP